MRIFGFSVVSVLPRLNHSRLGCCQPLSLPSKDPLQRLDEAGIVFGTRGRHPHETEPEISIAHWLDRDPLLTKPGRDIARVMGREIGREETRPPSERPYRVIAGNYLSQKLHYHRGMIGGLRNPAFCGVCRFAIMSLASAPCYSVEKAGS